MSAVRQQVVGLWRRVDDNGGGVIGGRDALASIGVSNRGNNNNSNNKNNNNGGGGGGGHGNGHSSHRHGGAGNGVGSGLNINASNGGGGGGGGGDLDFFVAAPHEKLQKRFQGVVYRIAALEQAVLMVSGTHFCVILSVFCC
jgi:hypothetical protein